MLIESAVPSMGIALPLLGGGKKNGAQDLRPDDHHDASGRI
jgi:hypothetical protein